MAETHEWYKDDQTGQYVHDVAVTIDAPLEKCFEYWSLFDNFPKIMRYVKEVKITGKNTQHWVADVTGLLEEWDAETTDFQPNQLIAWRSVKGLRNSGSIRFTPTSTGGCQIHVHLMYDPPYGFIGDIVAERRVNDAFHIELKQDLLNFKHAVESGELEHFRRAA